jgi:hypothetical protein
MGLIKASTGQFTTVYVANLKQFKTIKTVQALDSTSGAASTYANAFDSTSPIYAFTQMNDTPVTGKFDILATDNIDFQKIAMGYALADTFDGFDLSRAIGKSLYILANHKDINTATAFAALWLPQVNITSDGQTMTIKGVNIISYNMSASNKVGLPNPAIMETVTLTAKSGTLAHAPALYNAKYLLPAGVNTAGDAVYLCLDPTNGVILEDWTITGATITFTTYSGSTCIVAYQYIAT